MTRKLHNTLMAAIASSSLLVVGLIASSPVIPAVSPIDSASALISLAPQSELASNAIGLADTAPVQRASSVQRSRQSLTMPFFSFAPRS